MDRRQFLKTAAASVPCAHVWIPRIAIASISGDPRDAIIKARTVVADNWGMQAESSQIAAQSNRDYSASIKTAWAKMEAYQFVRKDNFSINTRNGAAMTGSYSSDRRNFCNSYFKRRDRSPQSSGTGDIAYVSTIPFVVKSFALQNAVKGMAASTTVDFFYPDIPVEIFQALIESAPQIPARVISKKAVWVTTYRSASRNAGNGVFRVTRRDTAKLIYEENFEYDFA